MTTSHSYRKKKKSQCIKDLMAKTAEWKTLECRSWEPGLQNSSVMILQLPGLVGVSLTGTQRQPDLTKKGPGIEFKAWETFVKLG